MTSIEELLIEETTDVQLSVGDVLEDIKDMISRAFESAKRFLAGGVLATMMTLSIGDAVSSYIIETPSEPIAITMPVKETAGSVDLAYFSESRQKVMKMIDGLSLLEEGWDGEIAKRPSLIALKNARFIVDEIDDVALTACGVFASNDAGVYLQSRLRNGKMTIFLNGDGMTYIVKEASGKLTASAPVTKKTVEYLNEGLKLFV